MKLPLRQFVLAAAAAIVCSASSAPAQDAGPANPGPAGKPTDVAKPVRVFILAGQSNTVGHSSGHTMGTLFHADGPKDQALAELVFGKDTKLSPERFEEMLALGKQLDELTGGVGAPKIAAMSDAAGKAAAEAEAARIKAILDDYQKEVVAASGVSDRVYISSIADNNRRSGKLGVGYGASDAKIGPEYGFGLSIARKIDGPILLIKASWGGKSLNYDFRPPSLPDFQTTPEYAEARAKAEAEQKRYEAAVKSFPQDQDKYQADLAAYEEQLKAADENARKKLPKPKPPAQPRQPRPFAMDDAGLNYRLMNEAVRTVLDNLPEHHPAYDPAAGYELAGFVWFQGFNDQFNDHFKANYKDNMVAFIKDIRREYDAPQLPFVIGVLGTGQTKERVDANPVSVAQREAAARPEFRGTVVAVESYPEYALDALEVYNAGWQKNVHAWSLVGSDRPYHYLGSGKFFVRLGDAFATAMAGMLPQHDRTGVPAAPPSSPASSRPPTSEIDAATRDQLQKVVTPLAASTPLNVLFIIADDLGARDITPSNPDCFYDTPHLERLAASGTRFTQAYAACPVCSPTRSAVLTGQWPARTRNTDYFGAPNQFFGQALPAGYDPAANGSFGRHLDRPLWPAPYLGQLAEAHTTLAEALQARGYATFFAGKWHLGPEGSLPEDHGFEINIGGGPRGAPPGGKRYFSPYGNPWLTDGPPGEHLPDRLARETADFIGRTKDRPFLAYLSFYSVHTPLMAPDDLVAKYNQRRRDRGLDDRFAPEPPRKNRTVQSHAIYGGMVEAMDAAVGKVLDALEEHGVADRTLVIFTSDNGGLSTSEGSPTSNLPCRAGKGWLYEGGIRVPLVVRLPGVTRPGSSSAWPVTSTDYFPTILAAAALPPLPAQHRDGVSFLQALEDPAASPGERPLFWHYPHWGNQGGTPGAAVRLGDWKLIDWYWGKDQELFNLAADPGEETNLAAKHPEKLAELRRLLDTFRGDTAAVMPAPNPHPRQPFDAW